MYIVMHENMVEISTMRKSCMPKSLKKMAVIIWNRGGVWKLKAAPPEPNEAIHSACSAKTPSSQSVRFEWPRIRRFVIQTRPIKRTTKYFFLKIFFASKEFFRS